MGTRAVFGGHVEDFMFSVMSGSLTVPAPTTVVTFWTAQTGGTQITDLQDMNNAPISAMSVDRWGRIAQFQGPDPSGSFGAYATQMWADGGNGTRVLMTNAEAAAQAASASASAAAASAASMVTANDSAVSTAISSGPLTGAALAATVTSAWKPSTAYTAGDIRIDKYGYMVKRLSSGTSRASYDATEAANWNEVSGRTHLQRFGAIMDATEANVTAGTATDNIAAMNACSNFLTGLGGGVMYVDGQCGFTGDFVHKARYRVEGASAIDYTSPATWPQTGLFGFSTTSRYVYGQLGGTNALGDTPGAIDNLVIDGRGAGGAWNGGTGDALFHAECVEGKTLNLWVTHSGGDAINVASAQNSDFINTHTSYTTGAAWNIGQKSSTAQGAATIRVTGGYSMYFAKGVRQTVASTAAFWCHEITFRDHLFESYQTVDTFGDVDNGSILFDNCDFSFSTTSAVANLNTMFRVQQTPFPTVATDVNFHNCKFAGAVTTPPQDAVTTYGTNYIHFSGKTGVTGCPNVVGLEGSGSASRVVQDGWLDIGTANFDRVGTGATRSGEYRRQHTSTRIVMPSTAVNPVEVWQPSDTGLRVALTATGAIAFGDGAGNIAGSIYDVSGNILLDGLTALNKGFTRVVSGSTGASGTLSVNTGTSSFYRAEFASNASLAVNLSGNPEGRVVTIALKGNGTNTLTFAQTIDWGTQGAPAAPMNGEWLVMQLFVVGSSVTWVGTHNGRTYNQPTAAGVVPIFDRMLPIQTVTAASQVLKLSYFTADRSFTISNIITYSTGAAGATPAHCYVALFSSDASGNLTLLSASANTTGLWAAANTQYVTALGAAQSPVVGNRYAAGLLCDSTATMPTWPGVLPNAGISSTSPRMCGQVTGLTSIPSSLTVGSSAGQINVSAGMPYFEFS